MYALNIYIYIYRLIAVCVRIGIMVKKEKEIEGKKIEYKHQKRSIMVCSILS